MPILLQRALLAFPVCAMLSMASTIAAETPSSETLWYVKPAAIWDEALPIGNGRLGAMVFGGANTTANNGDQQNKRVNACLTRSDIRGETTGCQSPAPNKVGRAYGFVIPARPDPATER